LFIFDITFEFAFYYNKHKEKCKTGNPFPFNEKPRCIAYVGYAAIIPSYTKTEETVLQQLKQRKCPTCGGRLELTTDNICECRSCHNVYELETDTELFETITLAQTLRECLNFKAAEATCRRLLKKYENRDLSAVYWELLLCEQRVIFETNAQGETFTSFYDIVSTDI